MRASSLFAIGGLGVAVISSVGNAATQRTGRITRSAEQEMASESQSIRTTHRVAACAARSRPRPWAQVLAEIPGSAAEVEQIRIASRDLSGCLGAQAGTADEVSLRFSPTVIRGPMAEALMKRASSGVQMRPFAQPFDMAAAMSQASSSGATRTAVLLLEMADCTNQAAPADVAALLNTDAASSEEQAVIRRISPHLGPCVPSGFNFRMNRVSLRSAFAEAAYRRQRMPMTTPPQPVQN